MIRSLVLAALAAFALSPAAFAQERLPRRTSLGAAAASVENDGGARIVQVRPGTPAERGGLLADDVVTAIAGQPITNAQSFVAAVRVAPAGRALPFTVTRSGAQQTVRVTLVEAPRETGAGIDVSYEAVRVDGTLRRTLISTPHGARGRMPALLLVGGIGCYSIDDASEGDDVYRTFAHDLGRRGILVMRLEKSGIGDSQGDPCPTVDFNAEYRSYAAALAALRADRRVNPDQVFIFGHSIGSIGAPRLANEQHVAGVIAAEGLGRTWIEYEFINIRRQIELAGASPQDVDATMILKAECVSRILVQGQPAAEVVRDLPDCAGISPLPASQAYMRQLTALNIAQPWTQLAVPALLIYGTSDYVTDEADHIRLRDLVNADHPNAATLAVLEGVNHGLRVSASQQAAMQSQGEGEPYAPIVSTTVGDWICARATCGS